MDEKQFKDRTKKIALRIIELVESLPTTIAGNVIGNQLLRSAASVGANYRAACRGKSTADVIHKLSIVEEEADESLYWLELLIECGLVSEKKIVGTAKGNERNYRNGGRVNQNIARQIKQSKVQNLKSKINLC